MAKPVITFAEKLQFLGFQNYAHYQRSKLWKGIRQRVFALRGRVCLQCQTARARVIHHTEYSLTTLQGLTIETLQPLCAACHDDIHGHGPDGVNKFKPVKEPKLARSAKIVAKPHKPTRQRKKNKNRKGGFHSPGVITQVSQIPGKMRHRDYVAKQKASAAPPKPKQPLPTKYCLSCLSAKAINRFAKHPQTGAVICRDCLDAIRSKPEASRTQRPRIRREKRRAAYC